MQTGEIKAEHERRVLKKFWDSLKQGKIATLKCLNCGAYTFPPVPICRECFSRKMQWVELSGEGKLLYFAVQAVPAKPFLEYAPFAYGMVKFKEGPIFYTRVEGVNISSPDNIIKDLGRLPLPVKAEFMDVGGLNTLIFRVAGNKT